MVPEGCLSQLVNALSTLISLMAIKFNSEECCYDSVLMKNSKKAYNSINFNPINVGVVWGVVMLIGGVVNTGCGLSLKQFWKSWSL